jgi:cell wall-associated NlpC family hydrolase
MEIDNPEKEPETISRREFLKRSTFTALAFSRLSDILQNIENLATTDDTPEIEFYDNSENQITAYNAIKNAAEDFSGHPYSWETGNHHCSGYAAQYFMHLGFKIGLVTTPVSEYSPSFGDPMPNSTTVKQVPYLKMLSQELGEDLATEIELKELLSNKDIWDKMPPGTVLYLPERIGHHGYDTFTHVAIFIGRNKAKEPLFAEFSVYMRNGPQYGHGFEQFTRMYRGQNIEPYNPANGPLKVFLFDAVEASKRINSPTGRTHPYSGGINKPHHGDLNKHQPY